MNQPPTSKRWRISLWLTALMLVGGLSSALFIDDTFIQTIFGNTVTCLAGLFAAIGCRFAHRECRSVPQLGRSWKWFAIGMIAWCLGTIVFSYYEIVLRQPPFPSWADPIYLCYYPAVIGGILMLRGPGTFRSRPKAILDTMIGFIAGVLAFGRLIVEPLLSRDQATPLLNTVLAVAYPALDLAIMWALFGMMARGNVLRDQAATFLLAAGGLAMMVADCFFGYQNLLGTWNSGQMIDSIFALSLCLFGLAGARMGDVAPQLQASADQTARAPWMNPWKCYIPMAVSIIVLLSVAWIAEHQMTASFVFLLSISLFLVSLVLTRMLVAFQENHELLAQLRESSRGLRLQSAELEDAHARLQVEFLRRGELEMQRREMDTKMVELQKLESLGVLAGGVAHDFNNLLTALLGNLHLAKFDLADDHPAMASIKEAERSTHLAADLTEQMLAYSGKGGLTIGPVDLNELTREMTSLLRASLPKNVSLTFDLNEPLPQIEGDATQIRQVVANLIINASESIDRSNGHVSLRSGVIEADESFLANSVLPDPLLPGTYVFLEVTDNGCGMSAETVARIFEPFFSTKFTGRGLGLAATLGVIRGHHGVINVRSETGEGTRFLVAFPALEQAEAIPNRISASEDANFRFPADRNCGCSAPFPPHEATIFDFRQPSHPEPALLEDRA